MYKFILLQSFALFVDTLRYILIELFQFWWLGSTAMLYLHAWSVSQYLLDF